jgi:hypothetical protein
MGVVDNFMGSIKKLQVKVLCGLLSKGRFLEQT